MLAEDRMARICEIVTARGAATLTELCSALDASESTIRRDLVRLDAEGRVERVHGGARAKSDSNLVSVDQSVAEKHDINAAQKRAIAEVAAGLVGPGDLVYIDSGTTCELMADYLAETRATYVTNSLPLAQRLLARGMQVILPGGRVKPLTEALVGEEAVDLLSRYHFTIGFWGTNGCDPATGFTTPEPGEAAVKRVSMRQCSHPFVLCDASKFEHVSLVTFADFAAATVICDDVPTEKYLDYPNVMKVEA